MNKDYQEARTIRQNLINKEKFINGLQEKKLAFGWYNGEFITINPEDFGRRYCIDCNKHYAGDEIDVCDIPF